MIQSHAECLRTIVLILYRTGSMSDVITHTVTTSDVIFGCKWKTKELRLCRTRKRFILQYLNCWEVIELQS